MFESLRFPKLDRVCTTVPKRANSFSIFFHFSYCQGVKFDGFSLSSFLLFSTFSAHHGPRGGGVVESRRGGKAVPKPVPKPVARSKNFWQRATKVGPEMARCQKNGSLPKPEIFWHGFWQYRFVDFQWFTTKMVCCHKFQTICLAGKEI
jgi:hypothetical protein